MSYEEWGFTGSPFQTTSLPSSGLGEKLLVGRSQETLLLMKRIAAPPKIATLEGLNGVGKTSVVNVASYRPFRDHIDEGKGGLYIPCRKIFQLNPNQDVGSFVDAVLMEVAQTLLEKSDAIQADGVKVRSTAIDRWLNAPQLNTYNAGFSAGVWGLQFGRGAQPNTSDGFTRSGFRKAVLSWLEQIYPTQESGGVICTIDNLELLQSSDTARVLLEQLRDELFNLPGLRWVLCGALGIIYGVVASPRLEASCTSLSRSVALMTITRQKF